MLKPGQQIDRYEVLEAIATGGMAEVFKVRHTALDTVHALKVLVLRTQDIRRRLLQEGRLQAALRHPNAIAVTDVIEVDGHQGLVMEYVDGPTLLDWCYDEQPDWATLEQVFRDLVAGVGAAHALGLVHRDLKPSNVLIDGGPGRWIPKVCDFGLAKVLKDQQTDDATRSGVPMGTPSYMAPEQIADAKSVGPAADVFSLGALLYYMCTGRKAFDGANAVETYNAVLDGVFVSPEEYRSDIPPHLLRTLYTCLRVDPRTRPASAQAVLELLDGGALPPARAASIAPQPRAVRSRSWLPWVALALAACFAGLTVGTVLWSTLAGVPAGGVSIEPTVPEPIEAVDVGGDVSVGRHQTSVGGSATPRCPVVEGLLGYAPVADKDRKGDVLTLPGATPLRAGPDEALNGCVLPAGTQITIVDRAHKKGGGLWLPVHAGSIRPAP